MGNMAHILPGESREWHGYRMASPPPQCPHGVPYAQQCNGCGWVCPTCKRAYAPWVRECSYTHEDDWQARMGVQPGTFAPAPPEPADVRAMAINLPGEWLNADYQRVVRIKRTWSDLLPGLQCYVRNPIPDEDGTVTICLRLTPQGDAT